MFYLPNFPHKASIVEIAKNLAFESLILRIIHHLNQKYHNTFIILVTRTQKVIQKATKAWLLHAEVTKQIPKFEYTLALSNTRYCYSEPPIDLQT